MEITFQHKLPGRLCGVYSLAIDQNVFYIGSSINIRKRLVEHWNFLYLGTHYNSVLQSSFMDNSIIHFAVLEDVVASYQILRDHESLWIYRFKKSNLILANQYSMRGTLFYSGKVVTSKDRVSVLFG